MREKVSGEGAVNYVCVVEKSQERTFTMRITRVTFAIALLTTFALSAHAEVSLSGIFTDNMVVQRGIAVPVFGHADPGEQVTVTVGDQSASAIADADGKWRVTLGRVSATGAFEMKISGSNEIVLTNLVLGDVWVCSGQSNMAFTVSGCFDAAAEIAAADYPDIRLFNLKRHPSEEPIDEVTGPWTPCSPETVKYFSAVGYFFGRDLHRELGVPIGLINTSWGGTPAEAWTSIEKIEANPRFDSILARWEKILEAYPEAMIKYENEMIPAWKTKCDAAKAAGEKLPRRPRAPAGPTDPHRPGILFNGMINPIIPFAIRGAIWYQGESNAGRAYEYRALMPTLIRDWRKRWGQGPFPFGIVQLANFRPIVDEPAENSWAELREAQLMTAQNDRNTGLAVIIEVGDTVTIHPRNKQTVGHRLALWALGNTYGQDIVYSGPVYRSMEIEGRRIRLHFDHVGAGLCRRVTENAPYPSKLVGFQIAGHGRTWHWADAKIDGNTVVVSSDRVRYPVAVRYGWAMNPVCNLFNKDGLPATPFRTDTWRGITWGR